jgi:hypothetical protein
VVYILDVDYALLPRKLKKTTHVAKTLVEACELRGDRPNLMCIRNVKSGVELDTPKTYTQHTDVPDAVLFTVVSTELREAVLERTGLIKVTFELIEGTEETDFIGVWFAKGEKKRLTEVTLSNAKEKHASIVVGPCDAGTTHGSWVAGTRGPDKGIPPGRADWRAFTDKTKSAACIFSEDGSGMLLRVLRLYV